MATVQEDVPIVTEGNGDVKAEANQTNGKEIVVPDQVVEAEEEKKDGSAKTAKADQLEESLAKVPIKAPVSAPKSVQSIQGIVSRVRDDPNIPEEDKIETLCMLLQKFVEENQGLKNEIEIVGDQVEKHKTAKESLKKLNETYKKQIELVREESKLRLEEEQSKRQESMGGYNETMTQISTLLETHTGQNSQLKDQNGEMSEQITNLLKETAKRETQIERMQTEFQLQLKLLEHQVAKAQIEKAEVKTNLTQERLLISQELAIERDRGTNLEQTHRLLREQAAIYQDQLTEFTTGAGKNTKAFKHFKTQIDKLTAQMGSLEKETAKSREKSELSTQQVKKMNQITMEKDNELIALRKKLESMISLNKTLSKERSNLIEKLKNKESSESIIPDK